MSKPRVLCAMSGGVDSSVAAYLLKEAGYDVVGMTMKTWSRDGGSANRSCCGIDDVDDARRVAAQLDIPYIALDMEDVFRETVIEDFQSEYLKVEHLILVSFATTNSNSVIYCRRPMKLKLSM